MATIDVECPECAMILMVEVEQLGTEVKCPKCKHVFEAQDTAFDYELSEDTTPKPRPARKRSEARPKPRKPETAEERKLRERMEKWADKME